MHISILLCCFNGERSLNRCIDSVLSQTYQDFTLHFLDDGSVDNTSRVIHSYKTDKIKCYKNDLNIGRGASRNRLLDLADTDTCCWVDADDYMLPTKIERQVEFFHDHADCSFLATEMFDLLHDGTLSLGCNRAQMINDLTLDSLKKSNCINHPTVMFKLDVARSIGFKNMKRNEDWDFYIRLYEKGFKVAAIPEPLYVYSIS